MPASRRNELLGIQYSPDEIRMIPPGSSAASSTVTSLPRPRAVAAATRPANPPPTTMTSVSLSQEPGGRSLAVLVMLLTSPFLGMGCQGWDVRGGMSGGKPSVLTAEEQQWLESGTLAHMQRVAGDDVVVAAGQHRLQAALDVRQDAGQDRRSGLSRRPVDAVELVGSG